MASGIRKKYKAIKWILAMVIVFCMVMAVTAWYITQQIKPIIKRELKTLVQKGTDGLYNMDYGEVDINFLTGTLTIADVKIRVDHKVYQQQILTKKAPNNLYDVVLDKLLLKRIHLFRLYFGKSIKINRILFDQPTIKMVNRHFDFNDNRPPRPIKSPYTMLSKYFKSLSVNAVDFENARFKYVNNNKTIPEVDSVSNLYISLKDWLIDRNSADDTTRFYLLKDVKVYLNNYDYATPDSMYHIKIDQLDFAAKAGKLKIKQFALQPRYAEKDFQKIAGYAKDRFSLRMNNLNIDSLNLPAYVKKREILANTLTISDGYVSVYNDNTYPKQEKVKTGHFPHQLLQKINELITVKKIDLNNIDISYAQFDKESQKVGKISFENTSGTIINATNAPKAKAKNAIMQADLQSYVMGQGKLNVSFKFDLLAPKGNFDYKGEMTLLDGRKLNSITKPLGMLQISKGLVRSLAFDIKANQDVAHGTVDFKFNDLSVAFYKQNDANDGLRRMGLISMLANALVIYSDNPNKEGEYTQAVVSYARKPTGSFFNFIWRTLFEGVKHSVGFSAKKQAEIKSQIEKFELMKKDREERKQRRERRKIIRYKMHR
jgi:hypothetical protein